MYAPNSTAAGCKRCPAGFAQQQRGSTHCHECAAGQFQSLTAEVCETQKTHAHELRQQARRARQAKIKAQLAQKAKVQRIRQQWLNDHPQRKAKAQHEKRNAAQEAHATSRQKVVLLGTGAALALAAVAVVLFSSRTGTPSPGGTDGVKYETVRTYDADESDFDSGYGSTASAPAQSETKIEAVKRD